MVARYSAVSLGLLAFAVTVVAGLFVRNPVELTLSRSVLALFLFYVIGFLLGSVADRVVAEHDREGEAKILKQYRADLEGQSERGVEDGISDSTAIE